MPKSTNRSNKNAPIQISVNLQYTFVVMVAIALLGRLVFSLSTFRYLIHGVPLVVIIGELIFGCFGLLLFIPAFVLLPRKQNPLQRTFMALLYTVMGYVIYELMSYVFPVFLSWIYHPYSDVQTQPNWIQMYSYTILTPLLVWLIFTGILLYQFVQRKKG